MHCVVLFLDLIFHLAFYASQQAAGICQPLDDRLIKWIHELVAEGVKEIAEMRRHLKIFVKEVLFKGEQPPQNTNRRYYPKMSDLRSHMYKATVKYRMSKIDQVNVQVQVDEWKKASEDSFFFRSHSDSHQHENEDENIKGLRKQQKDEIEGGAEFEEEVLLIDESGEQSKKLLFVHQAAWQRRLLHRYGNNICLLDATYKTTRYALPLFFIAVKTNVDYQVVGTFVTEDETVSSITEALELINQWNPEWTPEFFMTDNSQQEKQTIEKTFPGW